MSEQSLDSFKCRKTLKVGNKSYVYYSLKAAEKNGLTGISKLPYSLKVLLENLLRLRRRPHGHQDGHPGDGQVGQVEGQVDARDRLSPGARADAGLHRRAGRGGPGRHARCDGKPRRQPEEDQPACPGRPGHRPLGDGGLLRHGPARSRRTSNMEFDRNGERYKFLRGARMPSTISASCRRAPASATR
jgi:hypothetical protein